MHLVIIKVFFIQNQDTSLTRAFIQNLNTLTLFKYLISEIKNKTFLKFLNLSISTNLF